jgi:nucleotidyltransferase/DNA polymerase involved in DNA repair
MEDRLSVRPSVASRVMLHVDMDAFYAQVEMRRLKLNPSRPAAVQQWGSLIAVNYPARKAGVTRHVRASEARRLCPDIQLVHVDLLDERGALKDPATATQANSKVSLARYRSASHEIFAVLVRLCGEKRCEKASVDEAYLDVTHLCEELLATGRLPPQFSQSRPPVRGPPEHADVLTQKRWCAEGWLRPCPSPACPPCYAREALSREGYTCLGQPPRDRGTASATASMPFPDGSLFFVPPTPQQRWQLRTLAPSDGAATAAVTIDANATESIIRESSVASTTDTLISSLAAVAASSHALRQAAADCVSAVIAFVHAARWHVLDHSGSNMTLPFSETRAVDVASPAQRDGALGERSSLDPSTFSSPLGVRLAAGAVIGACIRRIIFEELALTCSIGVAHNKTLAKLASTKNKPDAQTIVFAAVVPSIMRNLPLQKIRFLGGKLGDAVAQAVVCARSKSTLSARSDTSVIEKLKGERVRDNDENFDDSDSDTEQLDAGADQSLSSGPLPTAGEAQALGFKLLCDICGAEDRATGLLRLLHGIDDAEIVPRSKPNQLGAGKSFSASACGTYHDACNWLRMLSAEIEQRIVEDTALFRRKPTTIALHYFRDSDSAAGAASTSRGGRSHSKSAQLEHGVSVVSQAIALLYAACVDEGVAGSLRRAVVQSTRVYCGEVRHDTDHVATDGAISEVRHDTDTWTGPMFSCTHLSLSVAGFIDVDAGAAASARVMRAFLASAATAVTQNGSAPLPTSASDSRLAGISPGGVKRRRDSAATATVADLLRRQARAASTGVPGGPIAASVVMQKKFVSKQAGFSFHPRSCGQMHETTSEADVPASVTSRQAGNPEVIDLVSSDSD